MTTPVSPSSLPWPTGAAVVPIAQVRPVLERLESLARTHARDLAWIPGLAQEDGEIAADPPPALEQITDEFGGIAVHGRSDLDLLIEERADIGPYTMLGETTSFYPLYEGSDVAVVLTLDEHGTPGAVYGIGEDLALRLAAPDLPSYLQRYADALDAAMAALDDRLRDQYGSESLEDDDLRADVAEQLLDEHLYAALLGMGEGDTAVIALHRLDASADSASADSAADASADSAADGATAPPDAQLDAPSGAIAVADLREAAPGACVDVMGADVPGDPLAQQLVWRNGGRMIYLVEG